MNPTNLMVWFTLTFLIFFLAATAQVSLVQSMGPGLYSSFTAIRIVGAVVLSSLVLHETLKNTLEALGVMINIVTMSIYLVFLYKDEWRVSNGGSMTRKNLIEYESKQVELHVISKDSMLGESASDEDDSQTDTLSLTKSDYHRLVKRK